MKNKDYAFFLGGGGGGADKVHYDNGRCASGEWVKALCNDFNTKFT